LGMTCWHCVEYGVEYDGVLGVVDGVGYDVVNGIMHGGVYDMAWCVLQYGVYVVVYGVDNDIRNCVG